MAKRNNKTRTIKIRITDEWLEALEGGIKGSYFSRLSSFDNSKAIRYFTMKGLLQSVHPEKIPVIQDQLEQCKF